MISINNLSKKYGNTTVLQVEYLEIGKGERFGLVGNNGAGKTTLFSLLMDLIRPSSGEVLSKEVNVAHSESWKNYTGAYLDDNFLVDFLLPEEYFDFVGKLYGMNKADISNFLSQYESFFNDEVLGKKKYIRDLSKGNQKKVGIVGAIMGNPEIVILDEPFANLDPSSQLKLRRIINDLPAEMTVLVSSHDLTHVTEVCRRIVVLERGQPIKDIDTHKDTLQELEAYFTAGVD